MPPDSSRGMPLKSIETDQIDRSLGTPTHLGARQPQRIEARFHVLDDVEPGVQREALENDRHAAEGPRSGAPR